jgi:hypothetical protein
VAKIWHLSILEERTEHSPERDTRYFVAADSVADAVRALGARVAINARLDASEVSAEVVSSYGLKLKPGEFREISVTVIR